MKDLSLVMSTGVDDYGNQIYREVEPAVPSSEKARTELSLYTIHKAFRNIDYEIVFVEWVGQNNGVRLTDWEFLKHPRIRIISVPYSFTSKVCPERTFHETHGKNIGIRRARGGMIMGINNDCLWLDEFPAPALSTQGVMVADRPTVYHPVLDVGKDIVKLKAFCKDPQNVVHDHDYNANGDFTMMSKDLWFALKGLCTPTGDKIAGVDMWQVVRAEQATGKPRQVYPHQIYHVRHPGMPLDSGYGMEITTDNWGFPDEDFEEITL